MTLDCVFISLDEIIANAPKTVQRRAGHHKWPTKNIVEWPESDSQYYSRSNFWDTVLEQTGRKKQSVFLS